MAIEYGYRDYEGDEWLPTWSREAVKSWCKDTGDLLIAREVSEPWVVSIRD